MGRIVFAAPGIARFHLHDRLGRELVQRGHQVDALSLDPVAHTFWRAQVQPAVRIRPTRAARSDRAPLAEFAAREVRRHGLLPGNGPGRGIADRLTFHLAQLLPAVRDWLDHEHPDLLLIHGERSAERQLLHFAAREFGIRTLWTGPGLLPHTMQFDSRGLDADSSVMRREVFEYRNVAAEPRLLDGCLAHALARNEPFGLARSEIMRPPLGHRIADAVRAVFRGPAGVRYALNGWRASDGNASVAIPPGPPRPIRATAFTTVLLQRPADERLRLDADDSIDLLEFARAATAATQALDPRLQTVLVVPPGGLPPATLNELARLPATELVPANCANDAAAAGVATMTINHPFAITALLAGTPVVNCGRALYGLAEITHRSTVAELGETLLKAANATDQPTLRQRFLTWLITRCHLWCSPVRPDHNGMVGLVHELEARLQDDGDRGPSSPYRRGPAWPLSV
ncbi:MAG: hypothetical protein NXI31_15185 [bacterium]|nr:hypothetical protein [bacterium]